MQTLFRDGIIVTCDAKHRVLTGNVLVRDRRIVAVGSGPEMDAAIEEESITRVIDARGCAIIPGLVQAHVHLCQALLRGMADDLPLLEWLKKRIWPLEAAHDEASLTASAELGLAEMSLAGTTTILDMGTVHNHDAVMDACVRSGMRVISGKAMMDLGDGVPKGLQETTKSSLAESDRLCAAWSGKGNGRIGYAYAPRFILSCSEELVRGAVEGARAGKALLHTHAAEHAGERVAVRELLGDEDLAILRKWGAFGPKTVIAHGVQLTDEEARQVARDGTRIVHCPSANLKLASGIARIASLDAAGVSLALGADGAPCNNNMDPWMELRHAALLAKITSGVTSLGASRAFRLATIDGARALGIDAVTGSIEPGKRADLAVVRLDGVHAEPGGDVFSKLVYACGARDVVHVYVDGAPIVRDREHQIFDPERVSARARELSTGLMSRAGLS
jgi:5-methylthioadenosine/S-adenosylhomocysteine deaminase